MESINILQLITGKEFQSMMLLLTALGACLAALFTAYAARATAKANIGQTLLSCLENYIKIMKVKRIAEEDENSNLAKEFYREIFDLHWSEFNLWHEGAIPNHVMRAWLTGRQRNFSRDEIKCKSKSGTEERITYKDVWDALVSTGYFELNDQFVRFMNTVHGPEEIRSMERLKKRTKPRN